MSFQLFCGFCELNTSVSGKECQIFYYVSVLQDLLQKSVAVLAEIPEESIFPLLEFGGL